MKEKGNQVEDAFQRLGGFKEFKLKKVIEGDPTFYYRNKGPSNMNDFVTEIKDPQGLIRFELSAGPTSLDGESQNQQILLFL